MAKQLISIRLDPAHLRYLTEKGETFKLSRTAVIEKLISDSIKVSNAKTSR